MFINRLRNHAGLFFRTHAADLICLGILTATVAFTAIQNRLPPGTILMGWDNLNPELNLWLNLKRSLFSVWQEYQGLGLLAGHGHAADLPRQLFLTALSPVVPINLLRWSWVMAMLAAGIFGVYALLRTKVKPAGALLGALFALTNLGTLQIFYTPFEPFVTQFGTIPWLLLTFLLSVRTNKRGWFLALAITSLVAAPQGFVQTVFFASLFLLAIVSLFLIVEDRHHCSARVKRILACWSIILAVNAFWLLPSAYFIATGSRVTVEAKINQMSTEEVYLRNQAFGSLRDTVQLKGFWFDTFDFDPGKSGIAPIYGFWRAYAGHPVVEGAILLLFVVILIGAVALIAKRRKQEYWLLGVFVVLVTLLTIDTPPFLWINDWLSRVPLFHQAYRIRFTKIASMASILYSLLFGIGSSFLLEKVGRIRGRAVLTGAMLGIIAGCFALVSAPIAQGNLFYPVVIRSLPQEYPKLFSYFQKKPAGGRIAVMPQPTYWGWKYERWGYTGWGFLWYGIENPILDRAFDPWSNENENYYWEISRSIYSKDAQSLLAVLAKYDVRYILLDENLISPSHNRALFTEEIKAMLAAMPEIKEVARFGKLTVYERAEASQSFISLSPTLPLISPAYRWTDNDVAYRDVGDYITEPGGYTYPFRSLFTKRRDAPIGTSRSVDEQEFTIEETGDAITIHSLLLHNSGSVTGKKKMDEQENTNKENRIDDPGVQIQINKINLRQIYHILFPPRVVASENNTHKPNNDPDERINNDKFYGIGIHNHLERSSSQIAAISDTIPSNKLVVKTVDQSPRPENTVGNITIDPTQPAERLVNNPDNTRVADRDFSTDITTTVAGDAFRVNVSIPKADALVYDSTKSADLRAENVKPCGVLREGEATAKNLDQFLRFTSFNQRGCLSFSLGNLPHRDGYLVAVESTHISGRPLLFSLINDTARHVELETYLERETSYFILPPLASDGLGYTVYLSNDAIGRQETVNDLSSIRVYRIPYDQLIRLRYPNTQPQPQDPALSVETVTHPNPSYYNISLRYPLDPKPYTLVLNQSFDPGWTAWEKIPTFPYLRQLKDHVLVNNWANGWKLSAISHQLSDKNIADCLTTDDCRLTTIVIFFWPQLLQWLGFALLPLPFLWVLLQRNR